MKGKFAGMLGAVALLVMVAATGATALVAPNLTTGSQRDKDSSKGADNGIHDTRKAQWWDCEDRALVPSQPASPRYIAYNGPEYIWPPNHKMRDVAITAVGNQGESVVLTVTGTHDQYTESGEELNGSGNTEVDFLDTTPGAATGTTTATDNVQIRGERSGRDKTGRTYTITSTATFDGANQCIATFTATVPHDQRNHENKKPRGGGGKKKSARRARR